MSNSRSWWGIAKRMGTGFSFFYTQICTVRDTRSHILTRLTNAATYATFTIAICNLHYRNMQPSLSQYATFTVAICHLHYRNMQPSLSQKSTFTIATSGNAIFNVRYDRLVPLARNQRNVCNKPVPTLHVGPACSEKRIVWNQRNVRARF